MIFVKLAKDLNPIMFNVPFTIGAGRLVMYTLVLVYIISLLFTHMLASFNLLLLLLHLAVYQKLPR